jgi:glutamine cyclotransferase
MAPPSPPRRAARLIALAAIVCAGAAVVRLAAAPRPAGPQGGVAVYGYRVVATYPHDTHAFTQGLIVRGGVFYESIGRNGQSALRKVRIETGDVLQERPVARTYFAEGLTDWKDRLIQLTWQTHVGFVYDLATFAPRSTFTYLGEGWGLTHDQSRLIMSDGSDHLRFLDPNTFREIGRVAVHDGARPVNQLNELELVHGEVFANVWQTDRICRIDPKTGRVLGWIDLSGLLPAAERPGADVLNGIAYDEGADRLFVTGKLWPKVFEIRLERRLR